MSKVDEILAQVDHLPSVPAVVQQVLGLLGDPEFRFSSLVELVKMDPGITAHVLRMANSPFFGLVQEVPSLEQALTYLGANNLVDIVLSSKMVAFFKNSQDGYRLVRGDLWRHSMAVALLAKHLGEQKGHKDLPAVFTGGLLHDVGKLVMSEYVDEYLPDIQELVKKNGLSFVEAERKVLGVDHGVLGGAIAKKWNFPEPISHAIAFHHDLEKSRTHRPLVRLVAISNLLVASMGVGTGANGLAAKVPVSIFEELDFRSREIDKLSLVLKDILDKADVLLGMAA